MSNFRVIVAFNRVDYFLQQFNDANERNYAASVQSGTRQQHLHSALRSGLQPRAAGRARLQHLLDRGRQHDRRPADRVPALREQLLHAAAAAGRGLVVVPAGDGQPRSHFGHAGARIQHAAGAGARRSVAGRPHLRPCPVQLRRGTPGAARRHLRARRRQNLRAGRSDRRRQDHHRLADGAALRSDRRARAARRPRHPLVFAGGARRTDRLHPAGAVSLHRHRPRQHRLRQRGAPAAFATTRLRRGWRPGISPGCWRGSSRGWRRP